MKHYIGVDIGGTNIVCGLINEHGETVRINKAQTEAERGSRYVIGRLAQMIMDTIGTPEGLELAAVGIGVPGLLDHERGISIRAVNLGWYDVPLAQELSDALGGIPVFIDNDVRMYVYGEAIGGAGRGAKHVLGITLGTGLAAAVVNEGKLYYGSGNRAGEIGHILMDGVHYRCNCGKTGCLETVASANGIARQAREALMQGRNSILREWFSEENFGSITAADVSKGYDEGDAVCRDIMRYTGTLLGKALAIAITLYSPDMIVIGGGASKAGERLFGPMREILQISVDPIYWKDLTIAPAERLEDAGVFGSAMSAKNKLLSQGI